MSIRWISFQPLIGGMALGAEKAFWCKPVKIISFSDIKNEHHLKNYWPDVEFTIVNGTETYSDIDVVSAVPICAGLSMQNASNRGEDATQNDNMYGISRYTLSLIKPKAYIFENAPNLYTNAGKKVRDTLVSIAKEYNYSISFISTSSIYHGLPQNRMRTFCVMWNSPNAPIVEYYNRPRLSLNDYLNLIPTDATLQENFLETYWDNDFYIKFIKGKFGKEYRQVLIDNNAKTILQLIEKLDLYDEAADYANDKDKVELLRIKNKWAAGGNIWDRSPVFVGFEKINALVGKTMYTYIHPSEERFYTIRDMLHLMGMPHDFQLLDAKKNVNHIAQNVPVNTACDWHSEVRKFIEGKLEFSNSDFIMQNNHKQCIDFGATDNYKFSFGKLI